MQNKFKMMETKKNFFCKHTLYTVMHAYRPVLQQKQCNEKNVYDKHIVYFAFCIRILKVIWTKSELKEKRKNNKKNVLSKTKTNQKEPPNSFACVKMEI